MSCSLWRWTESCDHDVCVGDCDLCDKNLEDELILDDLIDIEIPQEACVKVPHSEHSVLFNINQFKGLFEAIDRAEEKETLEETVQEIIKEVKNADSNTDNSDSVTALADA